MLFEWCPKNTRQKVTTRVGMRRPQYGQVSLDPELNRIFGYSQCCQFLAGHKADSSGD